VRNKLIKLTRYLKSKGLEKEATPLQDIINYREDGSESADKSKHVFPNPKEENYRYEDYFDSLRFLKSNVYVVTFDFKNAPLNILRKIGYVFKISHYKVKSYFDLISENMAAKKLGELKIFELQFPKIFSLIEKDAKKKGIDPDDVFIIIFNKGASATEELGDVLRNPYYFGHDVGHLIDDEIYPYILDFFNNNIFTHYKDEPKITPKTLSFNKSLSGKESYRLYDDFLMFFFEDLISADEDRINDLISMSLSGRVNINDSFETISSDYFPIPGKEYELKSDEDFEKVMIKLENFLDSLTKEINDIFDDSFGVQGKVGLFLV
jgi:hypothetical protein